MPVKGVKLKAVAAGVALSPNSIVPPDVVTVPLVPHTEKSDTTTPEVFEFSRVIVPPLMAKVLPATSLMQNTSRVVPVYPELRLIVPPVILKPIGSAEDVG